MGDTGDNESAAAVAVLVTVFVKHVTRLSIDASFAVAIVQRQRHSASRASRIPPLVQNSSSASTTSTTSMRSAGNAAAGCDAGNAGAAVRCLFAA